MLPRTYIPDLKTFPRPDPPRPPRLVSVTEMAQLLATASMLPPSHRNPLRAPTIRLALVLLFCCGLRRGELFRLKIRHFDRREKVLRIETTKFHKSRLVPLHDSVIEEVQRYLATSPRPPRARMRRLSAATSASGTRPRTAHMPCQRTGSYCA